MKHVFVETNWVFEFCAPAHRQTPEAQALADRAGRGELVLHIPAASLREGANAIRQKCQPTANKELLGFRRWAEAQAKITKEQSEAAVQFLQAYVSSVQADLATLDQRIDDIKSLPGIEVFALSAAMLDRAIELRREVPGLKPFDEAILAAVLVRTNELRADGVATVHFCDLDGDLVPIDRKGNDRKELVALYAAAGIVVRQDFQVPAQELRP